LILLDTHAVLWWFEGGRRLSARARREMGRADTLLVSPLTCWEVALLERRGRIRLDRTALAWTSDLMSEQRIALADLTPHAAASAAQLPSGFPGDPIDRFLYATARELAVPFVTKDSPIQDFARAAGDVRTIW
jgi:PIN domain nuclease of toxin-antitoxin system